MKTITRKPKPPKPEPKGYWANRDDIMFLVEREEGQTGNLLLAVYLDVCCEAARLSEMFPLPPGASIVRPEGRPAGVTFRYSAKSVKEELGLNDDEVFVTLRELKRLGIVWVGQRHGDLYEVMLPDFRPMTEADKERLVRS